MSDQLPANDILIRVRRAMTGIRVLGQDPTGAVVMAPDVEAALRADPDERPTVPVSPPPDGLSRLFGIPVEVLDTLPPGCWYLETPGQTARRRRTAALLEGVISDGPVA